MGKLIGSVIDILRHRNYCYLTSIEQKKPYLSALLIPTYEAFFIDFLIF